MLERKKGSVVPHCLSNLALILITSALSALATSSLTLSTQRADKSFLRTLSTKLGLMSTSLLMSADGVAVQASTENESIVTVSPSSSDIQAAIDGLPASGGIVQLSPGTYNFSSPISIRSNLTIEGPRTAILAPTANFGAFVNSGRISNVVFRGFTLNTSGIALANVDHITVQNVDFLNTGSTAISFSDPINHIQILDNNCENPATYFCFALGSSASPTPQDHDWIVRGNTMTNCASNCILVISGTRIVIADNVINGCGDTCIEVGTGTSLATVTGNVVDTSTSDTAAPLVGISTRSSKYSVVSGNSVRGNLADKGGACYLAWHGGYAGEIQKEENDIYVGNISVNCPVGFKAANASRFLIGAFDFDANYRSIDVDKDSRNWMELRSLGPRLLK